MPQISSHSKFSRVIAIRNLVLKLNILFIKLKLCKDVFKNKNSIVY